MKPILRAFLVFCVMGAVSADDTAPAKSTKKLKKVNRTLSCRSKVDLSSLFDMWVPDDKRTISGLAPIHQDCKMDSLRDDEGYLFAQDPTLKYKPVGNFHLALFGKFLNQLTIKLNDKTVDVRAPENKSTKEISVKRKNGVITVWYGSPVTGMKVEEFKDNTEMTIVLSSQKSDDEGLCDACKHKHTLNEREHECTCHRDRDDHSRDRHRDQHSRNGDRDTHSHDGHKDKDSRDGDRDEHSSKERRREFRPCHSRITRITLKASVR